MKFSNYERGMMGMQPKNGIVDASYKMGSNHRLYPDKDKSESNVDLGEILVELSKGLYYLNKFSSASVFNSIKNITRKSGQRRNKLLDTSELGLLTKTFNFFTPAAAISIGSYIGQASAPIYGLVAGLASVIPIAALNVGLNTFEEKNKMIISKFKLGAILAGCLATSAIANNSFNILNDFNSLKKMISNELKTLNSPNTLKLPFNYCVRNAPNGLNVRTSPNSVTDANKLTAINNNTPVRVINNTATGEWARVALTEHADAPILYVYAATGRYLSPKSGNTPC